MPTINQLEAGYAAASMQALRADKLVRQAKRKLENRIALQNTEIRAVVELQRSVARRKESIRQKLAERDRLQADLDKAEARRLTARTILHRAQRQQG